MERNRVGCAELVAGELAAFPSSLPVLRLVTSLAKHLGASE
jgi:hypothetical protein